MFAIIMIVAMFSVFGIFNLQNTVSVQGAEITVIDEYAVYDSRGIMLASEKALSDKTYTQIINATNKIKSDSSDDPVDRLITNNGTHFNVFSTYGSMSFNKSDCTLTFYNYGINPTKDNFNITSDEIFVEKMYWGLINNQTIPDITSFDCSITTSFVDTDSDGKNDTKMLNATRNHASGSYFKTTILSQIGQPFEDVVEFYNNLNAWDGDLISFVQTWDGLRGDVLQIKNGTDIGSLAVGNYTISREQVIDSGLGKSIIKASDGNNPFIIDLEKAKEDFGYLNAEVRNDGRVNLQFIFDRNVVPMPKGTSIYLDPEYEFETVSTNIDVLNTKLKSVGRGSSIVSGSLTLPIISGDSNKICSVYNVNDYINSEALTDSFICSGTQTVNLNERGLDIFSVKTLDDSFDLQIIASDNTIFNVDESQTNITLTFKKQQYFAQVDDNNIVTNVIVADDDFISKQSGTWVETWLDGGSRANHAGIGHTYNPVNDVFYEPPPSQTALLNSTTWQWYEP